MNEATQIQIERYLDGRMDPAEASAWLARLRGDPAALAYLGAVLEQQAHLFDLLREKPASAASVPTVPRPAGPRGLPASLARGIAGSRRRAALAAACALALAGGAWILRAALLGPAPGSVAAARLERVVGDVRMAGERPAASDRARDGQAVPPGRWVETSGDGSRAVLALPGAWRLDLDADARAAYEPDGCTIVLARGRLQADVTPRTTASPLALIAPRAKVDVLGTRLRLHAAHAATDVEVETGRVRLTRIADGAAADLAAGTCAAVRDAGPLIPRSFRAWRSYDARMTPDGPSQAAVPEALGRQPAAELEFYESQDDNGVAPGRRLPAFEPGPHRDRWDRRPRFNRAEAFWTYPNLDRPYPYAGLSAVGRGRDESERDAPEPLDVRDLQLHPPENDHLVVAAFIVPVAGRYRVSDLAARRVDPRGRRARFHVFDARRRPIADFQLLPHCAWICKSAPIDLGLLQPGDRIHFAVGREDTYGWDATEIAWTVTAIDP